MELSRYHTRENQRRSFPAVVQHQSPIRDEFGALERKLDEEVLDNSDTRLRAELAGVKELQRISTELIREHDVQQLYASLIDGAATLMRSDFATMQMLHPGRGKRGELQMLAHRGFAPEAIKFWECAGFWSPA